MALSTNRLPKLTLINTIYAVTAGSLLAEVIYGLVGYLLGLRYNWLLLPPLLLAQITLAPLVFIYLRRFNFLKNYN
jgi:hypothetical protein